MKKTNTFRRIAAFFAAIFIMSNSAMAQIKVVGDDYSSELTGSKSYYDRDVDFEKYFPSVSNGQIYPYSSMYPSIANENKTNLVGDTIYLCEPLSMEITNCNTSHSFKLQNGKATCDSFVMPTGYYLISGYVFCDDNEDTLRSKVGLEPFNGGHTCRELKKEILTNYQFDYKYFSEYQRLLALKPLNGDTVTTYYLYLNTNRYGNFNSRPQIILNNYSVLQRFYNQITNFIGKEINLVKTASSSFSGYHDKLEIIDEGIEYDGITEDPVKLEDAIFTVQDIVFKKDKSGKYNSYIVLRGEKTGTFTKTICNICYAFDEIDICDYYYRKKPNIIKDIPTLECSNGRFIIRCSDLKKIKQRTKELQAQKEREIKQQKAKKEAELSRQMVALYGAEFGGLIAKKQVSIGMTQEMCKAAWGYPMNTYRTTTRFGQSEVWCYNYKTKVYFFEGKVVKIDD